MTGTAYYGIVARTYSSGTSLTINAVDATGGANGILANSSGAGALSVTATGTVTGTARFGISTANSSAGTDLTIEAADVTGGTFGIRARNEGTGALSISTTGAVDGVGMVGIAATNSPYGSDLTIDAAGDVTGYGTGISADNRGAGALSITASGTVTVTGDGFVFGEYTYHFAGISAVNTGTDLTISAAEVNGADQGIFAHNEGTGTLSITATGAVGGVGAGIIASNSLYGTDLTINVAEVSGDGAQGIYAVNYGAGALSIAATGTVTAGATGIDALNYGAGLTIEAAAVTGIVTGINAQNNGSGTLSITTTGTVTGTNDYGIRARNSGADLTINAVAVIGYDRGIFAHNSGTGPLSITATGTVTAGTIGIDALNYGAGLTIEAAAVEGGITGINAQNNGGGALNITTTGTVTGTNGYGIQAQNSGTDLTINAAAVIGYDRGISARNSGTGPLSITTAGTVTGGTSGIYARNSGAGALNVNTLEAVTGTGKDGIYAYNECNSYGALTIAAADVTGADNGIFAENDGAAAMSITSTGTVTGTGKDGIRAMNYGSSLTIVAVSVIGGGSGIKATNYGSNAGALSITTTGTVTGAGQDGIFAANGVSSTGGVTIEAAAVTGGDFGILARNEGTALSISTTGVVEGAGIVGIFANNSSNGSDLSIAAADNVSGGTNGIHAVNAGAGALSITTAGTVTGAGQDGIFAFTGSNSTGGLTIDATGDVTGYSGTGINARNFGAGALSVTASGAVTGTGVYYVNDGYAYHFAGISAFNEGTDLTISAADVTGDDSGIYADNQGTGALSISTTGAVEGSYAGIFAVNASQSTELTVTAADVTGGVYGIFAANEGSGALSITATGTVEGTYHAGIGAYNAPYSADLTIEAATVRGGDFGIRAINQGTGALGISTTGAVEGTYYAGIAAFNASQSTDLTVTAGDVTGGTVGIHANNAGSGALSITVTGTVTGGAAPTMQLASVVSTSAFYSPQPEPVSAGIFVVDQGTNASAARTITVEAGGLVQGGTVGIAVESNTDGASLTSIVNSGTVQNLSGLSTGLAIQGIDVAGFGVDGDARLRDRQPEPDHRHSPARRFW